jgi:transcriptional regulator with XRE-family HTH domain
MVTAVGHWRAKAKKWQPKARTNSWVLLMVACPCNLRMRGAQTIKVRFCIMAKAATPMDALVGSRLRTRRKQLRISQERLGKEVGVSFQQIQKYENGSNRIGASRLAEISKVLDVPVAFFFTGSSGGSSTDSDRADARAVLSEPGATELLQAYALIESPALRNAVVRLARDLAGNFGDTPSLARRSIAHQAAAAKLSS